MNESVLEDLGSAASVYQKLAGDRSRQLAVANESIRDMSLQLARAQGRIDRLEADLESARHERDNLAIQHDIAQHQIGMKDKQIESLCSNLTEASSKAAAWGKLVDHEKDIVNEYRNHSIGETFTMTDGDLGGYRFGCADTRYLDDQGNEVVCRIQSATYRIDLID